MYRSNLWEEIFQSVMHNSLAKMFDSPVIGVGMYDQNAENCFMKPLIDGSEFRCNVDQFHIYATHLNSFYRYN
jgi:hypothetical protein